MRFPLVFALMAFAASPAFAKSLHWRAIDVSARLDRDGGLHIIERQRMVFDGDWNGGERTFRIGPGQSLNFESLTRIDDGVERPVLSGDLAQVDRYAFTSQTQLRWRSRLPDDPPFADKEITYVLKYTFTGVVTETDGVYALNHDFAFADRTGFVEHYTLRLDLDPVWRGPSSPVTVERRRLLPGEGVVVPLELEFTGEGKPASVVHTPSRRLANAVLVVFFLVLALLIFDFAMAENEKGRFARIPPVDTIDEAWLREHVFVMSPEAAGTAMDGKTDAAEVAAMLARMTLEKKISSEVQTRKGLWTYHQVLSLKLLVGRGMLTAPEKSLVQALFSSGDETDTDAIRKRYKKTGFDPADIVSNGLKQSMQRFESWERARANWKRTVIFVIVAGVALLLVAALSGGNDVGTGLFVLAAGAVCLGVGAVAAVMNSRAITMMLPRFALVVLMIVPVIALAIAYSLSSVRLLLGAMTPIAMCAWAAAITKMVLDILRTPETAEKIAFRKRLYAARRFFMTELRSPSPRLRDDWYPYFLAFGLGKHVDRWFGSFGAPATESNRFGSTSMSHTSSSGSSSTSAPSFTGGGGAFGGAGASGGWALAATAMGSGVSAPSSSSSGGGGGGGGSSSSSSSGGGGGGGW